MNNISKFIKPVKKKNFFISLINKLLICFILVITCLILMKTNQKFNDFIKDKLVKDNISFAYINNLYSKYFGKILPSYSSNNIEEVFNEKLIYTSVNSYYDGYKLTVNNKYLVPLIESGIVVFIGNIDNYKNVVIVEGIDGVDIWYGNISSTSVKLYDYVSKGSYLGETNNNNLYLVFEKNQEYLKFEDYFKN